MTGLSITTQKGNFTKFLLASGGVLLLLLTLYMLHTWLLMILVEGGLAPWDYGFEKPPTRDWQFVVNHYFTGPPGENTPSLVVFSIMAILLIVRCIRDKNVFVPLEFGLLNIGFVLGGALIATVVMSVYRPLIGFVTPTQHQGFHVTWPNIVISILILLSLFYSQATGWLFKRFHWRPSAQMVAMLAAISMAWWLCGAGITYQFLGK